jgi:hypothetical protein
MNCRQARWVEHLIAYNLEIIYRLGAENPVNTPLRRLEFKRVREIKAVGLLLAQMLLISEERTKHKQRLDR